MLESVALAISTEAAKAGVGFLTAATKRANDKLLEDAKNRGHNSSARLTTRLITTRPLLADSLVRHLKQVRRWSGLVSFDDMSDQKAVSKIHVPLDTYLIPRSRHESDTEVEGRQPLIQALTLAGGHCVILGNAGAGKTTSLKSICLDYFRTGRALLNYSFPIVIQLQDLDDESEHPLLDKLVNTLSLEVSFKFEGTGNQSSPSELESIRADLICVYLDSLRCIILLDGFDEIASEKTRRVATRDFDLLARGLSQSRIILTSRNHEFSGGRDNTRKFEIAYLNLEQVENFAERWLGSADSASKFLTEMKASPFFDVSIRPLTIAHLCAIYERTGSIPEKPKSAYERIVTLLLRTWDSDRGVRRHSNYSKFDIDRKRSYLAQLAFEITVTEQKLRFESRTLEKIYKTICDNHGLPRDQSRQVSNEIESHTGLFVQSGHDHFEFAHKSLREYLAADYIVRLPGLHYINSHYSILPHELAIATSLSSRPGDYLAEILRITLSRQSIDKTWYSVFAERLALEKPDLATGQVSHTTAYILHLIGHTGHQTRFIQIFSRLLPPNVRETLSQDYVVSKRIGDSTAFMRKGSNQLLPETLLVHQSLLSN